MKQLRLGGRNATLVVSQAIMFFRIGRLLTGLGLGFFAIVYLVIATLLFSKDNAESAPTDISVKTAENEGFPDQRYLLVRGGYIVFTKAQIALVENDPDLNTISAPVISDTLWSAWQENMVSGNALNTQSVRLLARFNTDDLVDFWSKTKENADQSRDLIAVKMDVTGKSKPMQETWVNRKPLAYLGETIDWGNLRVLDFEFHNQTYWNLAKRMGIALALATLSGAALLYRRPKPKLKVGDTYRFMRG